MKKELLVGGVAAALLFSQGIAPAAAHGKDKKKGSHKITILDRNKDGIPDKWELAYKLGLGKNVAKKDNDKDGLNNLIEYKLNLNPDSDDTDHDKLKDGLEDNDKDGLTNLLETKLGLNPANSDSNHNKISDSDEDSDKDGLSNSAEIELKLDPSNPDSDHDHVKDGMELSKKDGVKLSDEIRSFQLSIKTVQGTEIEVHYQKHNGIDSFSIKDKTGTITSETALDLMKSFYATSGLTKDEIISKVTAIIPTDTIAKMEIEVKYVNGKEVEAKDEEKHHEKSEDKDNENEDHQNYDE